MAALIETPLQYAVADRWIKVGQLRSTLVNPGQPNLFFKSCCFNNNQEKLARRVEGSTSDPGSFQDERHQRAGSETGVPDAPTQRFSTILNNLLTAFNTDLPMINNV
jgi:hypothetical protein